MTHSLIDVAIGGEPDCAVAHIGFDVDFALTIDWEQAAAIDEGVGYLNIAEGHVGCDVAGRVWCEV